MGITGIPSRFIQSFKTEESQITSQEREALSRIARRILDSGLVTPAIFFLEMIKPFSLLSSHALVFCGPIVTAFVQSDRYYRAAELLENTKNVEFLITEIERFDKEDKSSDKP